MRVLAIETSCDETAIAIAEFSGTKENPSIKVHSSIVSSQVKIHTEYGGVVPNLARREHQKNLVPILLEAASKAFLTFDARTPSAAERVSSKNRLEALDSILAREPELLEEVKKHLITVGVPDIDAVAVTYGPGLAPALWVGVNFAKALSYMWSKPLLPINHMAGHAYSALLGKSADGWQITDVQFPALALLVSGAHTELVLMRGHGDFEILGETLDDAAGEAFDKVARLLGLGYPGGPIVSKIAEQSADIASRRDLRCPKIEFPRPMLHSKDYDFSFSGLKTAVLYKVRDLEKEHSIEALRPVIAKAFQDAAVEVLVKKTMRAANEYNVRTVLLGGGVAANKKLRVDLATAIEKDLSGVYYVLPEPSMTGDNALMIALAGFFTGKETSSEKVQAEPNLRLGPLDH